MLFILNKGDYYYIIIIIIIIIIIMLIDFLRTKGFTI